MRTDKKLEDDQFCPTFAVAETLSEENQGSRSKFNGDSSRIQKSSKDENIFSRMRRLSLKGNNSCKTNKTNGSQGGHLEQVPLRRTNSEKTTKVKYRDLQSSNPK